jgi:hypothetical protein
MNYIARVKQVLKPGIHKWASVDSAGKFQKTDMPAPDYVVIEVGEGENTSCMMYRFKDDGVCCGDTWHKDFDEAKHQAKSEYGLTDSDWKIQESK